MLFKLAFRNVKRQVGNYLIYFITVSLTVALIFSINNMIFCEAIELAAEQFGQAYGEEYKKAIQSVLYILSGVLSIVTAFVLGYATSFLLRRRKKEFGLYLTMGMRRGDIVKIFAGETAFSFLLSLGVGMLLGMAAFQGIVAIFSNFFNIDYVFNSYSVVGVLITVIMVCAIFLFSSIFAFGYLKYAKISNLLKGENIVEKTVKRPFLWFSVAVGSFAILAVSLAFICIALFGDDMGSAVYLICGLSVLCCIAIVVVYIGLTKSIVPLLLRNKKFSYKGANTFALRLISGRLNANSMLSGVMAVLLSLIIVGANIFFSEITSFITSSKQSNPYDFYVSYTDLSNDDLAYQEFMEEITKHGEVEEYCYYTVYETYDFRQFPMSTQAGDLFIRESDYKKLCSMVGAAPMSLEGGYLILPNDVFDVRELISYDFSGYDVTLNGKTYSFTAVINVEASLLCIGNGITLVVPDEATVGYNENIKCVSVNYLGDYNKATLIETFGQKRGDYNNSNYNIQNIAVYEAVPSYVLETGSPLMLIILFVSAAFILLSMAVLALKSLSMVSEDKSKYRILWRLGAGNKIIKKTLFFQMFFVFFIPFIVPLFLNVPIGFICVGMAMLNGTWLPPLTVVLQLLAVSGTIMALYVLYFIATYVLAWRDVKKSLRSAE